VPPNDGMNPTAGGGLVRVSCLRSRAAGYAERYTVLTWITQ